MLPESRKLMGKTICLQQNPLILGGEILLAVRENLGSVPESHNTRGRAFGSGPEIIPAAPGGVLLFLLVHALAIPVHHIS